MCARPDSVFTSAHFCCDGADLMKVMPLLSTLRCSIISWVEGPDGSGAAYIQDSLVPWLPLGVSEYLLVASARSLTPSWARSGCLLVIS